MNPKWAATLLGVSLACAVVTRYPVKVERVTPQARLTIHSVRPGDSLQEVRQHVGEPASLKGGELRYNWGQVGVFHDRVLTVRSMQLESDGKVVLQSGDSVEEVALVLGPPDEQLGDPGPCQTWWYHRNGSDIILAIVEDEVRACELYWCHDYGVSTRRYEERRCYGLGSGRTVFDDRDPVE